MKNNQQKSPGCLYILFNVFVVMPFLVFLVFFVFAFLFTLCSKVHPAVLVLILIAVVAAAGYALYKKHEKKKQAEQNHIETVLQRTVDYPDPVKREPRQAPQPPDGLYEQDHLAKLAADQDARRAADAHYQAVVIDFETTGLNCDTDEILQVSIIDQDENVLINQYCRAVRHNSWESASSVNGIYPPRVAFCPPFEKVAPYVQDILSRADKVLAYNCSFEQSFLMGVPVGIPHNVGHLALEFQLVDALGLCRDGLLKLVLLELGKLRVDVGVDRAGLLVHLSGQIGRCQTVVAAALCELALDVVTGLEDGGVGTSLCQSNFLAELADVALHLIAEIADAVADVGQAVVELAELLAIEDFLLACRSGILTVLALTVAPQATAAHHGKEKKQDGEEENAATGANAEAVVVIVAGRSGDVCQRIVIHGYCPFVDRAEYFKSCARFFDYLR